MGKKGFTLIEVIVVVVLIGIMLALSIPRFRYSLTTNDLNYTSRRVIGLVKGLRDRAVRDNKDYSFHIDFNTNRFWAGFEAMTEEEQALANEKAFVVPTSVRILDVWTRSRGKQATDTAVVRFSRKGYVEQTMIHLEAADGSQESLLLTPFLGSIKVYDKYVDVESRNPGQ